MKPTNDIPTGTDLLIEKIDDLIEVIKHLTATIKEDRHDISDRRVDPEPGDRLTPMPDAPCHFADRTEANTDSSAGRVAWSSDILYSDLTYPAGTNSTIINREPREYNLNGIRCGIDMGVDSAGSSCISAEVTNARG